MSTHDPRKVIEDLRNHLAAHDKALGFLFGAGTSSSINIAPQAKPGQTQEHKPLVPSIEPLTELCKTAVKDLGTDFEKAWLLLETQCHKCGKPANIENILSRVLSKIDAIGLREKLVGLELEELEKIETTIRETIARAATPKEEIIPDKIPHEDFAKWIKKATRTASLEIFTTNYDILIERALEQARIPVFDGFVGAHEPFFYPDSIDREELLPAPIWVRLWKIHGSVNWQLVKGSRSQRVIRTQPGDSGEMILPSHRKYDESRKEPYTALLDRLTYVLNRDHSLLITCGYSFGDDHINAVVLSALDNRPTTHVISLQFGELSLNGQLAQLGLQRSNFMVLGPNAGVICGRWGTWRLLQPVDDRTCSFMDVAFDSNAVVDSDPTKNDEGGNNSCLGKMRLGDFNWFCKFLNTMRGKNKEEL